MNGSADSINVALHYKKDTCWDHQWAHFMFQSFFTPNHILFFLSSLICTCNGADFRTETKIYYLF